MNQKEKKEKKKDNRYKLYEAMALPLALLHTILSISTHSLEHYMLLFPCLGFSEVLYFLRSGTHYKTLNPYLPLTQDYHQDTRFMRHEKLLFFYCAWTSGLVVLQCHIYSNPTIILYYSIFIIYEGLTAKFQVFKEPVFSLSQKFENNTTQIPEFWPNSGIGGQAFMTIL